MNQFTLEDLQDLLNAIERAAEFHEDRVRASYKERDGKAHKERLHRYRFLAAKLRMVAAAPAP